MQTQTHSNAPEFSSVSLLFSRVIFSSFYNKTKNKRNKQKQKQTDKKKQNKQTHKKRGLEPQGLSAHHLIHYQTHWGEREY